MLFLIQHMTDQVSGVDAAFSQENDASFEETLDTAAQSREVSEDFERELAKAR